MNLLDEHLIFLHLNERMERLTYQQDDMNFIASFQSFKTLQKESHQQ